MCVVSNTSSICEHITFVNHSTTLAGRPGVAKTFELGCLPHKLTQKKLRTSSFRTWCVSMESQRLSSLTEAYNLLASSFRQICV